MMFQEIVRKFCYDFCMKLLIFLYVLRYVALFAFTKAIFIIINLDYFERTISKTIRNYSKILLICVITYKFFDISFGFIEQVEILNTK